MQLIVRHLKILMLWLRMNKKEVNVMRLYIKEQIEELIISIKEMHTFLITVIEKEQLINFLEDCQQAVSAIGDIIRGNSEENKEVISVLEDYSRTIHLILQIEEFSEKERKELDKYLEKISLYLESLAINYHVVFLPYKASMWDSLESIWTACNSDERCTCHVVPIPYFEYSSEDDKWEYHYEGNLFPLEIPITSYLEYSMEVNNPDIAYIHNPYDNCNLVTSVHPNYYSKELKKYIRKLVYVPYFVTSGILLERHLELPVCENMDYMVVQTKKIKQDYQHSQYYEKLIPLGSPKLDKIIKECQKEKILPKEWISLLKDSKILMLNTSINLFLTDGEAYIKKIKYIFEIVRKCKKIALIWRPHPLLKATIKSMRPSLQVEFASLVEQYNKLEIGVLDKTPDITKTVALCDGYIGEMSSSIVNLFNAAKKPVFILDNYILDKFTELERRRVLISDIVFQNNEAWFTSYRMNGLFKMDINSGKIELLDRVEGQANYHNSYQYLSKDNNEIYLSPEKANNPVFYSVKMKKFKKILPKDHVKEMNCQKIVCYDKKVFYLPKKNGKILEYDIESNIWKNHIAPIEKLMGKTKPIVRETWDYSSDNEKLWISAEYTNRILEFNMEDSSYRIHTIGDEKNGYSGIVIDNEYLWLAEVHSGEIIRWNKYTQEFISLYMPEEFGCWKYRKQTDLAHRCLIDVGEWIVTVPGFSNGMVKINKTSNEVAMMVNGFWKCAEKVINGYHPNEMFSSLVGSKIDNKTVMVQRSYDAAIAVIDIETEEYRLLDPILSEKDFGKLTIGFDGFEKIDKFGVFTLRESKIFSLDKFVENIANGSLEGIKDKQTKELQTMAENLDGSCGNEVHKLLINLLEQY